MSWIGSLRRLLHATDRWLSGFDRRESEQVPEPSMERAGEIAAFLRSIDLPEDARRYLEIHMSRIQRTLTMVPPPSATGRVLELGAYMQMTPALHCVLGYPEVRGAYFGKLGKVDEKRLTAGGVEVFRCLVDHFDAERDRFPYDDGTFDCVLNCEIFEHLLIDPMHMLLECRRVLAPGGAMVLTTPNVASYTAVARVLEQSGNPQLYSMYPYPFGEYRETEIPHVREYTPLELRQAVEAAGFRIDYLFTRKIEGYNSHLWVTSFLERNGYSAALRGEQMYCLAHRVEDAPVVRYPGFLYEGM